MTAGSPWRLWFAQRVPSPRGPRLQVRAVSTDGFAWRAEFATDATDGDIGAVAADWLALKRRGLLEGCGA